MELDTVKCKECTTVSSFEIVTTTGCPACGAEPYRAIVGERRADLSKPRKCRIEYSEVLTRRLTSGTVVS